MKITLQRIDDAFQMEARNEEGNSIVMDASPSIGGNNKGVRPMQTLLMGLAGCSSIDVINILKKQKQQIDDFRVMVDGEREPHAEPSLFHKIHIHFSLRGPLDRSKVERAIQLSVDKYCSVAKTLEKTAVITYDFEVKP